MALAGAFSEEASGDFCLGTEGCWARLRRGVVCRWMLEIEMSVDVIILLARNFQEHYNDGYVDHITYKY